jgi:pSer/pThr/pTyr-binding forkhead associated (FHA) protein
MEPSESSSTGPRPSAGMTQCPSCGAAVVTGLPFCPSCGKRLRTPVTGPPCARCGTGVPHGTRYCPACGLDVQSGPPLGAAGPAAAPSGFTLSLLDEAGSVTGRFALGLGETTIGREGAELEFPDDVFMSPLHAKLTVEDGALAVRDLGSRNGTWVFIGGPHRLVDGDRLLIGSQILEFRRLGYPGPHPPERDQTRRMGSLVPSADIACLTQLRADGSTRDVLHLSPGRTIRLGREEGDVTFSYDPSMSGRHAEIRSEDADFVIVDLESRNGVAVAARGTVPLHAGTRLLVGDKLLRVETE